MTMTVSDTITTITLDEYEYHRIVTAMDITTRTYEYDHNYDHYCDHDRTTTIITIITMS